MKGNSYPVGLNFGGPAAQRLERALGRTARENARRVQCEHCDLLILPENMLRHLEVVHGGDDD